jgi:Leucine-rich repeat (LRR) protein
MESLTISQCVRVIDLSNKGLTELPDLSKLINIDELNCSNNQITSITSFPPNVRVINCSNNQLTSLPSFPLGVKHHFKINCSNNKLTSLPNLPFGICELSCSNNQLTSLPDFPCHANRDFNYLVTINCSNNKLTSLPNLPYELRHLNCSNNQLSSLPTLEGGCLSSLDCSNNKLTSLPAIPQNLLPNQPQNYYKSFELFNCSNNQLTSLPYIHNGNNIPVICINNKLDSTNLPDCYVTIHFKPTITPIKEEEPIIKEDPIPNKKNMRIINKFKHLYYSLKFKKHFIKLLKKSRERKTNKINRIIISILLIILVIVVIKIIIMMIKIMFGNLELSNNQLPYSRTDQYELIKDKQIKQICITPSQTEPIQYIF